MANFSYNAIDMQGRQSQGEITASSRNDVLDELSGRGLVPVKVTQEQEQAHAGKNRKKFWQGSRITKTQIEAFTRELANLLAAGVPLSKALFILRREASNPAAKDRWEAIHDDVVGGKPLAEALARWSDCFPPVYIAMIRAGETGGFLDIVLNQIADLRSRESELTGRVKAALIYPAVLAGMTILVLALLMTFFIPRFTGIFEDFGATLPLLTRIIVSVSKAFTHYGLLFLLAGVGAWIAINRALRTEVGRRWLERNLLRVPALGVVLARFALVRFSRMLGTLLTAGVPLMTSLRVAREAIGNQTLSDAVGAGMDEVKQGSSLSRSFASCEQLFPPSVVEMIAVAEESGRLDKELLRLAQTYEMELDRRLRMLVALAEPIMLFIMAALIGTIVVGMLLPIFTLQELIK